MPLSTDLSQLPATLQTSVRAVLPAALGMAGSHIVGASAARVTLRHAAGLDMASGLDDPHPCVLLVDHHDAARIAGLSLPLRWIALPWPASEAALALALAKAIGLATAIGIEGAGHAMNASAAMQPTLVTGTNGKYDKPLAEILAGAGVIHWEWHAATGERRILADDLGLLEADGCSLEALLDPRDLELDRSRFIAALNAPSEYSSECRIDHPQLGLRWLRLNGRPHLTQDGQLLGFTGVAVDVSERHALDSELADLQALLHISLEAGQMYCWEWNLTDGTRRTVGPAQRIASGSSDPHVAQGLIHPHDIDADEALLEHAIARRLPYQNQFRIVHPNGQIRWIYSRGNPILDEDGMVARLSGVAIDITDLREAEQQLEDVNRRLWLAAEAAQLNPWSVDLVGEQHVCGPLDTTIYGAPITSSDMFHAHVLEEDHPIIDRLRDAAFLRSRKPEHLQFRARHLDGSVRWLSCWAIGVCDRSGVPVQLIGVTQDITSQKATEDAYEEAREWQRLAVSAGGLNPWRIELDTGIRHGGDLDRTFYACSPSTMAEIDPLVHPEDRARFVQARHDAIVRRRPYFVEYRIDVPGFGLRWLRDRGDCVHLQNHTDLQLVGVTLDITEQHTAHQELQRALELAHQASTSKSSFLAAVSHELRTPLNAVIGFSGLLDATAIDPMQISHLHSLRTAADQLLSVINDVLDFSRIEAGALPIEAVPFAFDECVAGAMDMVATTAEDKNLSLALVVHGDFRRRVVGDPTRIRQIAINILSNATKFTERGGVRIDLDCRDAGSHAEIALHIADSGIGMTSEVMSRLFEPFRQGEESTVRRYGGSGLGLSICKRLVELMDGGIEVDSEPDCGSRFSVRLALPYADTADAVWHLQRRPLHGRKIGICVTAPYLPSALQDQLREFGAKVVRITPQALAEHDGADLHGVCALVVQQSQLGMLAGIEALPRDDNGLPLPAVVLVDIDGPLMPWTGPHGQRLLPMPRALKPQALLRQLQLIFADSSSIPVDAPPPALASNDSNGFEGLRVLVVEDNEINRALLLLQLDSLGVNALVSENGQEALDILAIEPCSLVLMDVEMPGMDGMQATRAIRESPMLAAGQPYVVAVTAHVFGDTKQRMEAAGMDDFVSKPVLLKELVAALERGLAAIAPDAIAHQA